MTSTTQSSFDLKRANAKIWRVVERNGLEKKDIHIISRIVPIIVPEYLNANAKIWRVVERNGLEKKDIHIISRIVPIIVPEYFINGDQCQNL
jgi:hypothetical protein